MLGEASLTDLAEDSEGQMDQFAEFVCATLNFARDSYQFVDPKVGHRDDNFGIAEASQHLGNHIDHFLDEVGVATLCLNHRVDQLEAVNNLLQDWIDILRRILLSFRTVEVL